MKYLDRVSRWVALFEHEKLVFFHYVLHMHRVNRVGIFNRLHVFVVISFLLFYWEFVNLSSGYAAP
ncbi:hypothetical protein CPC08DRAFT_93905 [Agrocybe pediades]|nr:hypothetical protein CPC08DRAFT_93905 [Agrocybe pediades]